MPVKPESNYFSNAEYDPQLLPCFYERLKGYFSGRPVDFDDIECDISMLSPFAQSVLKELRKVKYGEVISYAALARCVGSARLSRAVGLVLKKNPIPIVFPCHRVIRADGTIGGFLGRVSGPAVDLKRKLLCLENVEI